MNEIRWDAWIVMVGHQPIANIAGDEAKAKRILDSHRTEASYSWEKEFERHNGVPYLRLVFLPAEGFDIPEPRRGK